MKYTIALLLVFSTCIATAQKYLTRSADISFSSKTLTENIVGINHEASAVLDAGSGDMMFVVPIRSFKFEKELMEEHFNENYMESDKFPKAEYRGKITNMDEVNMKKEGMYNVKTVGKLTIHGKTRDVAIPGTITVKKGSVIMTASFKVKCADYGIKVPSVVAMKVAEDIAVTVNAALTGTR